MVNRWPCTHLQNFLNFTIIILLIIILSLLCSLFRCILFKCCSFLFICCVLFFVTVNVKYSELLFVYERCCINKYFYYCCWPCDQKCHHHRHRLVYSCGIKPFCPLGCRKTRKQADRLTASAIWMICEVMAKWLHVSEQLPIYISGRQGATLAFIWKHVCVHLMNFKSNSHSPFCFVSSPQPPDKNICISHSHSYSISIHSLAVVFSSAPPERLLNSTGSNILYMTGIFCYLDAICQS